MADYCGPECYKPGGHHGPPLEKPKAKEQEEIDELKRRLEKLERESHKPELR